MTRWARTSVLGFAVIALTACTGHGSSAHSAAGGSTNSVAGSTSPTAGSAATAGSYGSLPSFLPTSAIEPDSILVGTVERPALTTEGDAVDVRLAGSSARAQVTGPQVPGEGLPYQASATTCTWTVELTATTGLVRIAPGEFTAIDHLGNIFRPTFVPGSPRPATELHPGQTAHFELRTVMPTGEGLLRWAPDGRHIASSWDFEVEND